MKKSISLLLGIGMMMATGQAFAHAVPETYEPASSSILEVAPSSVTIYFSERIEQSASSISIFAPDGTQVDGPDMVDLDNAREFSTVMTGRGAGTYAVSWQVVSADDGHFTKGGFIFSVGTTSDNERAGSGQLQIQHRSGWVEATTLWLELLGQAIVLASLAMIPSVFRRIRLQPSSEFLLRIRRLLIAATVLIILGSISYLFLKASQLSADQGSAFSSAFVSFLKTTAGSFTVYRLVLSMVVCTTFIYSIPALFHSTRFTKREAGLFLGVLLIALLRAQVSHAAASEFLPTFSVAVNFIHLVFKDLWIGGLVVFIAAYLPVLRKNPSEMMRALTSCTYLVVLSLLFGGLTGMYMVWLHLKSTANLFTTHWGGYFLLLSVYAVLLLAIRLYEELVVFPSLAKSDAKSVEISNGAGIFLCAEMLTGLAALFFSSILIITTPPLSKQHFFSKTVTTSEATITLGEHPYEKNQFLIDIHRTKVMTGGVLTVTLQNKEKDIGPIVIPVEKRAEHEYVLPMSVLSPPGVWTVSITEQIAGAFDAVADIDVNYPADVDAVRSASASHTFGLFEFELLVLAVLVIALAVFLYRKNRRLESLHTATNASFSLGKWFITYPILFAVFVLPGFGVGMNHGSSAMRELCKNVGGWWHESVPMREGVATSDTAVLGCMVGMGEGAFHFADPDEFAYFTRHSFAFATLETDPPLLVPGKKAKLLFNLQKDDGTPVEDLVREHDRILHAVVVSQDFTLFSHLHVEDQGPVTQEMLETGIFPVSYTFPKLGRYLIGVDYTVRAKTFADVFYMSVQDPNFQRTPSPDFAREKTFEGMNVTLSTPSKLVAGVPQKISYTFMENGQSVKDLQPYLSAAMHMSVVKSDLRRFVHTHAELPQSLWDSIFSPRDPLSTHSHMYLPDFFGPTLVSYVVFPQAGTYEIFGEVNRGGKIVLTRFAVEVEEEKSE